MTTYADVAAFARQRYLPILAAAMSRPASPIEADVNRPLGGRVLARWFARVDGTLPPATPESLAAAHAMLAAWCDAAAEDAAPVYPRTLERAFAPETVRAVLAHAFRGWAP